MAEALAILLRHPAELALAVNGLGFLLIFLWPEKGGE